MSYTTRRGERRDFEEVAALWRRADAYRRGVSSDDPMLYSFLYILERLESGWFFVAESGGKIVGVTRGSPARENSGNGDIMIGVLHVSFVAVDPTMWGSGVGISLMEETLAAAAGLGYTEAQLWVHVGNERGNKLYTRFGFHPSGIVRNDEHGNPMERYVLPNLRERPTVSVATD